MLNESLISIRKFHRISQTELATSIGVSKSYISEVEAGKKKASSDLLGLYAKHFNIAISSIYLLGEAMNDKENGVVKLPRVARKIGSIVRWISTDT